MGNERARKKLSKVKFWDRKNPLLLLDIVPAEADSSRIAESLFYTMGNIAVSNKQRWFNHIF